MYVVARKEGRNTMHQQSKRRYHSKGTKHKGIATVPCLIIVFAIITGMAVMSAISRHYYMDGTTIQGVDCSKLSVEEAKERIEQAEVTIKFFGGKEYHVQGTDIGRHIVDLQELEKILDEEHKDGSTKEFNLSSEAFTVDQNQMLEYLKSLKELDSSNMQTPKNAYLELSTNGLVKIIKEQLGNKVNYNSAINLAKQELKAGGFVIDFTAITEIYPEVKSSNPELVSKMEQMNKILSAKIELELRDGSLFTLDNKITRTWVSKDENGELILELDENLMAFVNDLNQTVQDLGKTIEYETPSHEVITVSVIKVNRDCIEQEIEFDELKSELQHGETVRRVPNYKILNVPSKWKNHIYVSKKAQMVYVFEGTEIIRSMPCITGLKGTSRETHTGLFYLILKQLEKDFKLGGHSKYWMMYNYYGEGFHDASWQREEWFTPTGYEKHGSHGCVNLKDKAHGADDASWLYNYITKDMPIIVD